MADTELIAGSPEWCAELDRIGYRDGYHEPLSKCLDFTNPEYAGKSPEEVYQEGWLDYAEDDGD